MSIVSSLIVADQAQADGRRWIQERHTDQVGLIYEFWYLAAAAWDANAALAARAVTLAADILAAEVASNVAAIVALGSLATLSFVYSTVAQARAALRLAYAGASKVDAVMIGDFLGSLTDVQLIALFGLTAGQVTTLRTTRLTPAASTASTIRAAVGQ